MDLNQELERVASLIERRLDALLSPEPAPSGQARLIEAMRYAALGGGKRLRPFLLIGVRAPVRRGGGGRRSTPPPRSNACIATR